jgi:putative tricarboxylic transport membrane protein
LKVNQRDFATSVVLLIVTALLWGESYRIPKLVFTDVGSAFFPRIVIVLTAVMSVILMIESFRVKPTASKECKSRDSAHDLLIRWSTFGLVVAYVALLPVLGYTWATIGFLVSLMLLLGPITVKSVPVTLVVTLVTTFGVKYVFGSLLKLFLP